MLMFNHKLRKKTKMIEIVSAESESRAHGDAPDLDHVIVHNEKVVEIMPDDSEAAETARIILDAAYAEKHNVSKEVAVDEWRFEKNTDVEQLLESGGQHELTPGAEVSDPAGAQEFLEAIGWDKDRVASHYEYDKFNPDGKK